MAIARFLTALAALALMAMPTLADPRVITGTVLYRERMALPAGATLHVELVALPGQHPVVGAGATLVSKATPPLEFTLNIRSDLDVTARYGLVAEIISGGVPLMRNPVPTPVDFQSANPVAILVQRLPPQPEKPTVTPMPLPDAALLDTPWQVTSIGGRPVLSGKAPTLAIAPDLRAGGTGGCNSYFTQATYENGKLTFGPAAATRMACAPEVMEQEADFFAALAAVFDYEADDHGLRLLDAAGVPMLGLVAVKDD